MKGFRNTLYWTLVKMRQEPPKAALFSIDFRLFDRVHDVHQLSKESRNQSLTECYVGKVDDCSMNNVQYRLRLILKIVNHLRRTPHQFHKARWNFDWHGVVIILNASRTMVLFQGTIYQCHFSSLILFFFDSSTLFFFFFPFSFY